MAEERLQKLLAHAGVGSRRACEEMIVAGRVAVDGRVVTELGTRVDAKKAKVEVDGKPIRLEGLRYIILHKPQGILSGVDPKAGYPSWETLVKVPERLYAVGRLDHDSEGLLLLTNDGELALHLSHPRYEHPKTYLVQVEGVPNPRKLRRLQHGVMLDDGPTLPARVTLFREMPAELGGKRAPRADASKARGGADKGQARPAPAPGPRTSWLKITLREGRKRQVRRMVGLLGHPAVRVIRVGLGPLTLADLQPGKWRDLTSGEVRALREAAFHGESDLQHDDAGKAAPVGSTPKERKAPTVSPKTIAIDGPSASGKSTIGGLLAEDLGYLYFDTGVMYRAVAAVALTRHISPLDEDAVTAMAETVRIDVLSPTIDDGRDVTVVADGQDVSWDIRRMEVEKAVTPISAYAGVREAMRKEQRRIGEAGKVVMVGRDIGTVVLPDAELKIYLDATLHERARRRFLEREERGEKVTFEQVLADVERRDRGDSSRQHAPLRAADDAILVETTGLDIEQVMDRVGLLLEHWRRQRRKRMAAGLARARKPSAAVRRTAGRPVARGNRRF
jgi:CMP/dCMP kinase